MKVFDLKFQQRTCHPLGIRKTPKAMQENRYTAIGIQSHQDNFTVFYSSLERKLMSFNWPYLIINYGIFPTSNLNLKSFVMKLPLNSTGDQIALRKYKYTICLRTAGLQIKPPLMDFQTRLYWSYVVPLAMKFSQDLHPLAKEWSFLLWCRQKTVQ